MRNIRSYFAQLNPRSAALTPGIMALAIILGGGLIILLSLLFLGSGIEYLWEQDLLGIDVWLLRQAAAWHHPDGLDVAQQITALGGVPVLSIWVTLTAVYLGLAGRRGLAILAICLGLGTFCLVSLAKPWIGRSRPALAAHRDPWTHPASLSFPSGHSLSAMAIYVSLAYWAAPSAPTPSARRLLIAAALGLAILIGLSRIYLQVHYPSDVLAGWLAGIAWMYCCIRAAPDLDSMGKSGCVESTK